MIFKYINILLSYGKLFYNMRRFINSNYNDLFIKKIIENIKDSGAVAIKLSQWSIPRLNIGSENIWIKKFEELYDNCNWHSLEYTKNLYNKTFDEDFDNNYIVDELLGSGSIGQVYKIKNKITNEYDILKVRHPNIEEELKLFKILTKLLHVFMYEKFIFLFPFDIKEFVGNFEKQVNFINEANNIIYFSQKYRDNDYIVIPKLKKCSESILIMSYENSERIDNNMISVYRKYKLLNILYLFVRNNEIILNYNHGDLHKGNWGIRDEKIVIYDFGFCYSANKEEYKIVNLIPETFDSENIVDINKLHNNLQIIVENLLVEKDINLKNKITELIKTNFKNTNTFCAGKLRGTGSPEHMIQLVTDFCRKNKCIMKSKLLNYFILFIQCHTYYDIADVVDTNRDSQSLFKKRYVDIITLCNTYNIFPEYSKYLVNKLNNFDLDKDSIFDTVHYQENIQNELYEIMKKCS